VRERGERLCVAIRFICTTITMNSGSNITPHRLKVIMLNRIIAVWSR
jgi:hypothetical protein